MAHNSRGWRPVTEPNRDREKSFLLGIMLGVSFRYGYCSTY